MEYEFPVGMPPSKSKRASPLYSKISFIHEVELLGKMCDLEQCCYLTKGDLSLKTLRPRLQPKSRNQT